MIKLFSKSKKLKIYGSNLDVILDFYDFKNMSSIKKAITFLNISISKYYDSVARYKYPSDILENQRKFLNGYLWALSELKIIPFMQLKYHSFIISNTDMFEPFSYKTDFH